MNYTLKHTRAKIKQFLNLFDWGIIPIQNNTNVTQLNNLINIRICINGLAELGLFTDQINALKSSALYNSSDDFITIIANEANSINNMLTNLKSALVNFETLLDKTVPEEKSESINIKLPPVNDFDDLSNFSRDFHIALTQVLYLPEISGKVHIESVENGSIWLNIIVGSSEALTLVASLAWSAAVIYKKVLEGKAVAEHVRSLSIKNESLEDLLEAQKKATALLIQGEAEHIQSENFRDNINENVERIKNSVKLLSELIEKGAVIQPSMMAPENVKNLFPNTDNLVGLESRIKKLNQ